MSLRLSISLVSLLICFGTGIVSLKADDSHQRAKVVLRMVGHKILLNSNDSTSRVLPVKYQNGKYKISFDAEFEFIPEELVATTRDVVSKSNLARAYIVEVENCIDSEVVYSYEIADMGMQDIVACQSRKQPKGCYNILFTLLEAGDDVESISKITGGPSESQSNDAGQLNYFLIAALLFVLLGVFVFLWRKGRDSASSADPNVISIGSYRFDKLNTELLLGSDKIELTGKEAELLNLLYEGLNSTIEREKILNKVWGDEGDYVGRTLDVFISKLRKKLEGDTRVKIVNVRGVGYKLIISK